MKNRSMYKAEQLCLETVDRISILPQPILETILCLLPTEEAARTSILSREWRYKWTTIPKLEFYDICELKFPTICQVLLRHQGPIHKLTLFVSDIWECYDCSEFDQIILHLSKNHTVKELILDGTDEFFYDLPISIFSLHHLTSLYLDSFDVELPPMFSGFGNLGNLNLSCVKISRENLLRLLSSCQSLKILSLRIGESDDKCTINELFKCLSVIEHLTISSHTFEWLDMDSVPQELPTSLNHLKDFRLEDTCFAKEHDIAFLLALIKRSPNLETIAIGVDRCVTSYTYEKYPVAKEKYLKYLDVWLDHLNELKICYLSNSLELDFVKFMLARSPKLKKVFILGELLDRKLLKMLLRAPSASKEVVIYHSLP